MTLFLIAMLVGAGVVWYMQIQMYATFSRLERDVVRRDTSLTQIDLSTFSAKVGVGNSTVLVLGDCMAVSCGVTESGKRIHHTLLDLLGPSHTVRVWGRIGAQVEEVYARADSWAQHAEEVVLFVGPNNITHGNIWNLIPAVELLLHTILAQTHARRVYWVVGSPAVVPAAPYPIRIILRCVSWWQAQRIRTLQKTIPQLTVVSVMDGKEGCPFARNPDTYFALDMFHPSEVGYAYIAQAIVEKMRECELPTISA
jgi:hypothetical protein